VGSNAGGLMHLIKNRGFVPARGEPVTPRRVYAQRRDFLTQAAALTALGTPWMALSARASSAGPGLLVPPPGAKSGVSGALTMEKPTAYKDVTGYNNFYEFGTDKSDPAQRAGSLKTRPWTVVVEGEAKNTGRWDLDALRKLAPMEERIYRLRCVRLVDGDSVGRLFVVRVDPPGRAQRQRALR
jgi:sulfoxide reductase catalytic subunit YedY